jgi:hypothetical protein
MAKSGEIRGFSVEGYFNDKKVDEAEQKEYEDIKNKIFESNVLTHGSMMVRKECINKLPIQKHP